MDSRTILLISRGTMSGGHSIGECLEKRKGIRCLTREDLVADVNRQGDFATRVTAQMEHAMDAYEEFSELRRPYLILMKMAILEEVRKGQLAYLGYSGHLLLDRARHFVRIRLIAPMGVRIARTRQRLGLSEAEARDYIRRVDNERTRWARFMYGRNIQDLSLYDLCLNIERVSIEGACDLLLGVMQQADFQATPESIRQVENDFLATQALVALVKDPRTFKLELGATAAKGSVRIEGPYLSETERQTVLSIASSVPGVRHAEYEPGYAPAFRYAC